MLQVCVQLSGWIGSEWWCCWLWVYGKYQAEQELLDLGMQHSIQQPIEAYWTNLILETEHAIKLLDPKFQDANRLMATEKLKQIHNANNNSNVTHKTYSHIARNIRHKLDENKAMVTQADKGKTTVIIYKQD